MSTEAANIMREVHVTSVHDICLVLPSGELKIYANVAVLRNASPVFRTMLGPDYLEGQTIDNTGTTPEIALHEDDAQAMLLLMQILHLRFQEIREAVAHPEFLVNSVRDAVILADKYDVLQAVNASFHLLASKVPEMTDMGDVWFILSASYMVGNRDAFRASSARLIMHCNVAYSTVAFSSTSRTGGVPLQTDISICMMLEEKRSILRTKVYEELQEGIYGLIEWSLDDFHHYMPRLAESLDKIRDSLTNITSQMWNGERFPPWDCRERLNCMVQVLDKGEKLGLCFDCVGNMHEARGCTRMSV